MAERIPARLNGPRDADAARTGRQFGLTVGAAFATFAAVALWRGRTQTSTVLGVVGGILILAALTLPRRLVPVERAWMKMAHAISKVTTPIFMGVIYFLVFTPVAIVRRAAGRNALVRARSGSGSGFWIARPKGGQRSDLHRQF